MIHAKSVTNNLASLKQEHEVLQAQHHRTSLKLDSLRKKEGEFSKVITERVEQVHKIGMLEAAKLKLESWAAIQEKKIAEQDGFIADFKN